MATAEEPGAGVGDEADEAQPMPISQNKDQDEEPGAGMGDEDDEVQLMPISPTKDQDEAEKRVVEDLLRQVEYYFGYINLKKDAHIMETSAKYEGWFPMAELVQFPRMQKLFAKLPENKKWRLFVSAIQSSEIVEMDQTDVFIRRKKNIAFPRSHPHERTIFIDGFDKNDIKLNDLVDFYSKYEGYEAVILRNYLLRKTTPEDAGPGELEQSSLVERARNFKGSIFVVFKTVEAGRVLLKEKNHTYRGRLLSKMWQEDYRKKQAEEAEATRKRRLNQGKPNEAAKEDLPKGTLLKISNISVGTSREDIKATLDKAATLLMDPTEDTKIAFIDFQRGDPTAIVRFAKAGIATKLFEMISLSSSCAPTLEVNSGKKKTIVNVVLIVGDEETNYLEKVKQERLNRKRSGQRNDANGKPIYQPKRTRSNKPY